MSPISQLICFTRAVTNVHWPAEYGGIILHHQQIDLFLTKSLSLTTINEVIYIKKIIMDPTHTLPIVILLDGMVRTGITQVVRAPPPIQNFHFSLIFFYSSPKPDVFFHFYFFLVLKLGCSTYIDSFDWIGFQSHFIFHFFMRTLSIHISDVNKDLACTDKDQKPTRTRTRT